MQIPIRHLFSVATASLLMVGILDLPPAFAAQNMMCDGTSLIAELSEKSPARLSSLLAEASKEDNSQAVFWRIEKGDRSPSYILGTLHIAHKSLQGLSPIVRSAISDARVVALEQKELSRGAYGQTMAQAGKMMSASDKPLQRMLDEGELKVVEKAISAAGYPEDLALGIRPWVATLFLAGSCPDEGHEPMDLIIANQAKSQGKQTVGLETLLEQFESLASIPDESQAAWLRASIEMHDRLDDVTVTMVELYHGRHIAASLGLTRELAPHAGLTDTSLYDIHEGLIGHRNVRLAERSGRLFEDGGAFVAIGAAHLPGHDGVISILKRNGFTATPIE
jgi:hypothetical protein